MPRNEANSKHVVVIWNILALILLEMKNPKFMILRMDGIP